ncbi:MAG: hypothetical protein ACI4FY_09025 [Acetatifactor sp.]
MDRDGKDRSEIATDIDTVVALLDGLISAGDSRIKLNVEEGQSAENIGSVSRQYHHGRCDVGSPWAKGTAFDVLE